MVDIVALGPCLHPHGTANTLRQCRRIGVAMLVVTGRVTRLGLSRWAGTGGSDRSVQRFCATVIPWARLFGVFFRYPVYRSEEGSLLVGDAGSVTKAGKTPEGRERFFARLYGQPGPGLACFAVSLVRLQPRRAFPLRVEQVVRREAETAARKAKAAAQTPTARGAQRRPGRPQGSKHRPQADRTGTPALGRMTGWLAAVLPLIAGGSSWTSWVLDGPCGNHPAWQMARPHPLPRIAKRRCEAALYVPSTGPSAGRGPRRN